MTTSPDEANGKPNHEADDDNARSPRGRRMPGVETASPAPRRRSRVRRALLGTAGAVACVGLALAVAVIARQNRTFSAPAVDLHASRDPAVLARGRYLVNGAGHCAECHGAPERQAERAAGHEIPLSGGFAFHL